jgi:hypothetical protein
VHQYHTALRTWRFGVRNGLARELQREKRDFVSTDAVRQRVIDSVSEHDQTWAPFGRVINGRRSTAACGPRYMNCCGVEPESCPFPSLSAVQRYLCTLQKYELSWKVPRNDRPSDVAFRFEPVNLITQTSAVQHLQASQAHANGNIEVAIDYLRQAMAEHGQVQVGDVTGATIAGNLAGLATQLYYRCRSFENRLAICSEPWKLLHDARNAVEKALHSQPASPRLGSVGVAYSSFRTQPVVPHFAEHCTTVDSSTLRFG